MKLRVLRVFPVALIAVAVLSCADRGDPVKKDQEAEKAGRKGESGLDLVKKGHQAEVAGRRSEALDAYTQAVQAGDLTSEQLAFAYYRRGGVKGFTGDNVSAIGDFSEAIELNSGLGQAYSLRGYLRGVVGEYDLAEKDHLAAINLGKDQKEKNYLPWVLQHYADLWRRRGDFDKALSYCEKALEADYPSAHFRRAWVYLDMGRTAQAKAEFEEFEQKMKRQKRSYEVFWPDERDAISKLRELR